MPEEPKNEQQTEQTPKGLTVPVPKRDEFFGNLKKVAEPEPSKPGKGTSTWREIKARRERREQPPTS